MSESDLVAAASRIFAGLLASGRVDANNADYAFESSLGVAIYLAEELGDPGAVQGLRDGELRFPV